MINLPWRKIDWVKFIVWGIFITIALVVGINTCQGQDAPTVLNIENNTSYQKTPIIDIVIKTDKDAQSQFGGTIRVFIEDSTGLYETTRFSVGVADTATDGKIWFQTKWGSKWYTTTFEKGRWWTNAPLVFKPGAPEVMWSNMLYVNPDGDLMYKKDTIERKILLDNALFTLTPYTNE